MKNFFRISFFALSISFIVSCQSETSTQMPSDSSMLDTTMLDTTQVDGIPHEETKSRKAILGYSYFKNMRLKETRNIYAYVSILDSVSKVIDTLRKINSDIIAERENDTTSIFTQNINLFKFLEISLIDPDSDFVVKQVHENGRQLIDSLTGNSWMWTVTPKTDKEKVRLILRVIAEKADGSRERFEAKNIPVDISVGGGFLRGIYLFLRDNPEKALVLVLIPLVGFFWKQISALFSKKPKMKS